MRNKARIDIIMNKLKKLWHKCPDWRFTQLISNINGGDVLNFYQEDDEFLKKHDEFLKRLEKSNLKKGDKIKIISSIDHIEAGSIGEIQAIKLAGVLVKFNESEGEPCYFCNYSNVELV